MRSALRKLACVLLLGTLLVGSGPLAAARADDMTVKALLPLVQRGGSSTTATAIVVDHTCTDITEIPDYWLQQAKTLTFHYSHTSHGSQIIAGLLALEAQNAEYSVAVRSNEDNPSLAPGLPSESGALRIFDETYSAPEDYWSTTAGLARTRATIDTGLFEYSMWSWCGQQSTNAVETVQQYLQALATLDAEYSGTRFIYMTGHTDGTGSTGTLERNNDLVREYVSTHNAILFDFADIEQYDPAGNYYADATDACTWCATWCTNHPSDCVGLTRADSCQHSHPLMCKLKAQAFWWLMARLAGWDGVSQ